MALASGTAFLLTLPAEPGLRVAAPGGQQLPVPLGAAPSFTTQAAAGTSASAAAGAMSTAAAAAALLGGAAAALGRSRHRAVRTGHGRLTGVGRARGRPCRIETQRKAALTGTDVPAYVDEDQCSKHEGGADADFVKFRQNFAESPEKLLNAQVRMELEASHQYLAMAAYFDRADVALPGFSEWAKEQSEEEREHGEKFIEYINLRGGDYIPMPIDKPERATWSSALDAMKFALTMEMQVNKSLLNLHVAASDATDPQLCDFLEEHYLKEQVESINKIAKVVRKLIRAGPGLGEYTVDKHMKD